MRGIDGSIFEITLSDENANHFIKTLEKYHANLEIEKIDIQVVHSALEVSNGSYDNNAIKSMNKGLNFSNLSDIIEQIKNDTYVGIENHAIKSFIILKIKANIDKENAAQTLLYALPKFLPSHGLNFSLEEEAAKKNIITYLNNIKILNNIALKHNSLDLYDLSRHAEGKVELIKKEFHHILLPSIVNAMSSSLPALTKNQFLNILNKVHEDFPLQWVYDLPSINAIYAQTISGDIFAIKYGNTPCIELPAPLQFDIESGFEVAYTEAFEDIWNKTLKLIQVPKELSEAFNQWKKCNYTGAFSHYLPVAPSIAIIENTSIIESVINSANTFFGSIGSIFSSQSKKRALSQGEQSQNKLIRIEDKPSLEIIENTGFIDQKEVENTVLRKKY